MCDKYSVLSISFHRAEKNITNKTEQSWKEGENQHLSNGQVPPWIQSSLNCMFYRVIDGVLFNKSAGGDAKDLSVKPASDMGLWRQSITFLS